MKYPSSLLTILFLGLTVAPAALANTDVEREALAKLIHELTALESLIQQAESNAAPDARIRFRYDWLRQDLKHLKDGIQSHLDAPHAQPRSFPPLRGDYRR